MSRLPLQGSFGLTAAAALVVAIGSQTAPEAHAALLTAGDIDGGSTFTLANDDATPRPQFATWLANEINNRVYHGGQPLEFDQVGGNHHFGHTFDVTPGTIDLSQPVCLTIQLFGTPGSNDGIGLQAFDGPTSPTSTLTYPRSAYPSSISGFWGSTPTSSAVTVDLRTISPTQGPLSTTVQSIAQTINTLGYLDVWIGDDTSVDYMQLKYQAVPEPSTAVAGLLAVVSLAAVGMRARLG